jgi:CubicO group peptidase (beta-lactamase class C family)
MKKIRAMLMVAIISIICNKTHSQPAAVNKQLPAKLDRLIQKTMETIPAIPAIAVSLVDENGPLLIKGYGWADKEGGIKADENSLFYIASNTKAFMGLAAALLDHEKKIFLDSSFKNYLTKTRFKNEIGSNVTIRNLLTHTSGLENNALVFRMAFSGQIGKDEITRVFSNETISKKPYGVYDYDNLGYNIYGLLLQEYLNKKWQDVLQEKIFIPLDMNRTTAYISVAEKNHWTMAAPYYAFGEKGLTRLEMVKKDNTMHSAGGLITSASDMAKWMQVQINRGKINNKQVFPPEVIKATQTGFAPYERKARDSIVRANYALGWNESKYRDEELIWHTGGYPGWGSSVYFMPGKKIGVTIMVNESKAGPVAAELLTQFVFDWATGAPDAEEIFLKHLDELAQLHDKSLVATQKSYADRANRVSQLTMPLDAYVGKYSNDVYGDIEIKIENNALAVHFGNLHAVSTPFTQKETIRVQLMPDTGEVVSFKTDESGKVNGLVYSKLEFRKN